MHNSSRDRAKEPADNAVSGDTPPTVGVSPASHDAPWTGTQFGKYLVGKLLGRGGMGAVYLAEDTTLKRKIALKVPFLDEKDQTNRAEQLARFLREGRLLASIHHLSICTIHEVAEVAGQPYMAMAYLEGRPLADLLRAKKRLNESSAVRLVLRIAEPLKHLHDNGIIHRDLKPQNIMIAPDGRPILMDFGLAMGGDEARMTQSGQMLGTVLYMPPEQMAGKRSEMTATVDVYSLGVIFFEALTGRFPYEGDSALQIIAKIATMPPVPPSQFLAQMDRTLERIILQAIAKSPAKRYASINHLIRDLQAWRKSHSSGEQSAVVAPHDRNAKRWAFVLLPLLLLVCLTGVVRYFQLNLWPSTSKINNPDTSLAVNPVSKSPEKPTNSEKSTTTEKATKPIPEKQPPAVVAPPVAPTFPFTANAARAYQQRYAVWAKKPAEIVDSNGSKLVLVPPGDFMMGAADGEENAENDEKPLHRVRITKPFYFGVTEVTQAQYHNVTRQNDSRFRGDDLPVEKVSWFDAVRYCNALSSKEGLRPCYEIGQGDYPAVQLLVNGNGYRLPTEAEWEYACRAGNSGPFNFEGAISPEKVNYDGYSAYGDSAIVKFRFKTVAAGSLPANGWGLHEMHGNVWEWCWDAYDRDFYKRSPEADPINNNYVADRVSRGGSWFTVPEYCRSAHRGGFAPAGRNDYLGFRIARVP